MKLVLCLQLVLSKLMWIPLALGQSGTEADVWDGEPEGVYVPTDMPAQMVCSSDEAEIFVAGARSMTG